jgi:flagellar basal-body rod modification protein FlgD
MEATDAVNSTSTTTKLTRKTSNQLGKDDFLKLLVTQLQYQDPLKPMENTDFIAQTAQFTALEQMQNLAQATQMQQATTMIGKDIKAEVIEEGVAELKYGRVTSVRQTGSEIYLSLNTGDQVKLGDVKSVLGEEGLQQEAVGLVGSDVYYRIYGLDGKVQGLKEATIVGVQMVNGELKLKTSDGALIGLKDIWNVLPAEEEVEEGTDA